MLTLQDFWRPRERPQIAADFIPAQTFGGLQGAPRAEQNAAWSTRGDRFRYDETPTGHL